MGREANVRRTKWFSSTLRLDGQPIYVFLIIIIVILFLFMMKDRLMYF